MLSVFARSGFRPNSLPQGGLRTDIYCRARGHMLGHRVTWCEAAASHGKTRTSLFFFCGARLRKHVHIRGVVLKPGHRAKLHSRQRGCTDSGQFSECWWVILTSVIFISWATCSVSGMSKTCESFVPCLRLKQ
jgi:hypothetical protein